MPMATLSPMMVQWQACKQKADGAIVLFRLGDFYEAFEEDAVLLAKELDLTLTKRQETPMSGVPAHTIDTYIDRLVARGHRVAVAEQMEDPKTVKGIVKREIVRFVTPGTIINSTLLSDKKNNFIAAISVINEVCGLALLDLTTAEFRVQECEVKNLQDEIFRLKPSEILISKKHRELVENAHAREPWHFDPQVCADTLLKHFKVHNLDGFGLKGRNAAINAAGALLLYVKEDLGLNLDHIKVIHLRKDATYLELSHVAQKHLELDAFLQFLDHTQTPMGGRLFKNWVNYPLISVEEIYKRQEAIVDAEPCNLEHIRDLERMMMRIQSGYATPKDIAGLRFSLEPIPELSKTRPELEDPNPLIELIKAALVDNPPFRVSDGGIFREGYNAELDELRNLSTDSSIWIANYQTQLREETQIRTLKVGFTGVFGYYIEVPRSQTDKMPIHFQRRQTLVNTERYITPELKEYENKIQSAEYKLSSLEAILFQKLREQVAGYAEMVLRIAEKIAHIDCIFSLARVSQKRGYIRPTIDDGGKIEIKGGRHPVIENDSFIPNDTLLDNEKNRLILITGPNMAGKSTYIRQTALLCIMAQIGSFIPADAAHIGVVDKVFTRIGASDDLSRGQSTFMVEMTEAANILHNATSKSLIILDEVGRGTSTYDGIAIAWAICEHLKGKTLFATHYWELTELPGAVNYHVSVHEGEDGIIFLRKIVKGSTDKSFGIHVAKLAGLPHEVIVRAKERLKTLEIKQVQPKQLELFKWKS